MGLTSKSFDSKAVMDTYVQDPTYGQNSNTPFLCFGVNLVKNGDYDYTYYLRFNVSGNPDRDEVYNTLIPTRVS